MKNKNIINTLIEKKISISTAESLTGGLLGSSFVDISGASNVYKGTLVAYDLSIKETILDISKDILKEDAVNQETANLMAKNISKLMVSNIGVSTTGIAETYDERPCQMYMAIYDNNTNTLIERHLIYDKFEKNRNAVRKYFVERVLSELEQYIKSI